MRCMQAQRAFGSNHSEIFGWPSSQLPGALGTGSCPPKFCPAPVPQGFTNDERRAPPAFRKWDSANWKRLAAEAVKSRSHQTRAVVSQ